MRRKKVKRITVLLFLILTVIFVIQDKYLPVKENNAETFIPVIRVHDGDTVSVIMRTEKENVRLIGIDVPEIGQIT